MPSISIIIPAFNALHTLPRCLKSIADQTFHDTEIIIVNDGSTDATNEYLKTLSSDYHVITQTNQGAPSARNRGAKEAQGEFLLFCDADITLKPNALALLVATLQAHPTAAYAYSGFRFGWKQFKMIPFDPERLQRMPYIHTTALIRRALFPGFDPSLKRFQDWDMWLTLLERGQSGVGVPEVLFRVRPGGTMSRWIPKALFQFPFASRLTPVKAYEQAAQRIADKHGLTR